jgi:hypothetical protein
VENHPCFNLTVARENWRQELLAQRSLSAEARRELSAHLQDTFEELRGRGLNEEESFWLARKRTGELQLLNLEFKRAMKTTLHHWTMAFAAWIVFIVSFFLPALDEMPGWKAAILQGMFWSEALQGDTWDIHYLLLTLANLLMLASPFLLAWAGDDVRFLKWLRGLSLGAMILVWSFLARLLLTDHNGGTLKIGCYLWAVSFVLLFLASLLQTARVKNRVAQVK